MNTVKAIKRMFARERLQSEGDIAGVIGVIVSPSSFDDICKELEPHGWDVSGDELTINTCNGPTLVRRG